MTGPGQPKSRGISPNLALDELVAARRALGEPVVHLGFGEARLPVFEPLVQRLTEGASRNNYGPVVGDLEARSAVAGYFTRRRLPTDPEQVVLAPGSKPLLAALQLTVPGDVLLPRPCWNTYAPQAELAGHAVLRVDVPEPCGGIPEPAALDETVRAARSAGRDPRLMVLTLPDNPTGTLAPPDLVRQVCAVAREHDLLIVSDEIYRDVIHDPATPMLSPAEVAPERTVVTTGLSKSLALGGWRIGAARFPEGDYGDGLRRAVAAVASEIWSTLAGPMQHVAAYAFSEPPEILDHLAASARLHGAVAHAVYAIMRGVGAACREPTAGFYVYPDFEARRTDLARLSVRDSASLQECLLERYGVAVLGGHHHGDDERALRFRAATSMLYGETPEQRLAALSSPDPAALPHIARELSVLEENLAKFCG